MKLCKDCKWCDGSGAPAQCGSPRQPMREMAKYTGFGENIRKWKYCELQREDNWLDTLMLGTCGKRGRFWEAK